MSQISDISECVERVKQRDVFLDEVKIGLGVDRLDYTKGIIERFRSIERLLEKFPQWIGKFSFVQIAAPSRSSISAYRIFDDEAEKIVKK